MAYRVVLYRPAGGDSPVTEFLEGLADKDHAKIVAALDYLGQQGPALRRPHAAHVRGKLWELRVSLGRHEYRLFYFFMEGQVVVVAHGFVKKTQAIPVREIETAEKRMKDYEARVKKGEVTP
jgi:phage-related protein